MSRLLPNSNSQFVWRVAEVVIRMVRKVEVIRTSWGQVNVVAQAWNLLILQLFNLLASAIKKQHFRSRWAEIHWISAIVVVVYSNFNDRS